MAIQRWDPMRDLMDLQGKMKTLFDEALARSAGPHGAEASSASGWQPPMDLYEEPKRYVLQVDLPGVAAAEVDVQVEDGNLVLRGERKMDPAVKHEAYLRVERPYGRFAVRVALPPSVEPGGIQATHRNGVIEVALPKREPEPPSRIEVASS